MSLAHTSRLEVAQGARALLKGLRTDFPRTYDPFHGFGNHFAFQNTISQPLATPAAAPPKRMQPR
jgi:hypothetical protein